MADEELEIDEKWINSQRKLPYPLKIQSITKIKGESGSHRVVVTNFWGNTMQYVVKDGNLILESEVKK